jgi:pimeloyl-ACP methyl ester carboxylesterase
VPIAQANGLQLYHEIHGDGPAMLCVQGLSADSAAWIGQVPLWSQHYRTVVFDNRDCGRSTYVEEDYDVGAFAADALALADAIGLERFHLVGQSLGGAIAQEVALRAPDRILTLTLVVTFAGAGAWMRERARLEQLSMAGISDEQRIEEMMLLTLSAAMYEKPGQIAFLKDLNLTYAHRQRRDGFLRQLRASATHEARERLPSLRVPTHVIGAEQDILVPVWRSRELAELIPGARLSVVPGSGHSLNTERPGELAELVHGFVQSTDPAAGAA